jgi:hypothetical protein
VPEIVKRQIVDARALHRATVTHFEDVLVYREYSGVVVGVVDALQYADCDWRKRYLPNLSVLGDDTCGTPDHSRKLLQINIRPSQPYNSPWRMAVLNREAHNWAKEFMAVCIAGGQKPNLLRP